MWKTIKSEKIVDTFHVSVFENSVELPDGSIIDDFYTVSIPDAAMIAAVNVDGNLILKSEYRYAIGEKVIECPAGMFEENETDPLVVAKRELLEETGYTSNDWTYLGATLESTSKLTNRMHLFIAKDCVCVAEQKLDKNEHIDLVSVPVSDAVKMVMEGTINANSSAHLILKVDRIMRGV
ncbi:MAG: NUDIX hydrolase [Pseudobutyrivibrio sp.]|nr:NUDIX hydrolase [Pseudobutyrivibrio sp.]